jgi:hypothetical protein
MAAPATISSPNLEQRLAAFKALVDRGANIPAGRASPQYLAEVDSALAQITQLLATDQRIAAGTCSGGFIGLGQTCRDSAGGRTTRSAIDAAKELAPADAMIQATLRGIVERHTERQGRSLGRQASSYQRDLAAAQQRATAAAADLRAGRPGAAEALSTAIAQIRGAVRGAGAEVQSDTNAIAAMRRSIDGFQGVARDTGLLNRRRTENAALNAARAANDQLRPEIDAQRQIATRGPDTVRPLATAQLEADPAFASRGYTSTLSTIQQWQNVTAAANATNEAAAELAGTVSSIRQAHATVAAAPTRIPQLESAETEARGASNAAGEALQRATASHARAADTINNRFNVANAAFVLATRNAVEAEATLSRRRSEYGAFDNAVDAAESEVSAAQRALNSASSGTTPMPGTSNSGGGTAMPGTSASTGSSGTAMPGSGGSNVSELRQQLADARTRYDHAVNERNGADARRADAARDFDRAAALAAAANGVLQSVVADRNANDQELAGYDQAARNAADVYRSAQQATANARASLASARSTIQTGERDVTAAANAYNATVPRLNTAITSSTLDAASKQALAAIPNPPITVADAAAAVRAGANGVATLERATDQLAGKTSERVTLGNRSREALEQRATGMVDTRVREALN